MMNKKIKLNKYVLVGKGTSINDSKLHVSILAKQAFHVLTRLF